jgi:hypothetical protein
MRRAFCPGKIGVPQEQAGGFDVPARRTPCDIELQRILRIHHLFHAPGHERLHFGGHVKQPYPLVDVMQFRGADADVARGLMVAPDVDKVDRIIELRIGDRELSPLAMVAAVNVELGAVTKPVNNRIAGMLFLSVLRGHGGRLRLGSFQLCDPIL